MRTTIELPDALLREIKASAALQGMTLKDYFAQIARADLLRPMASSTPATRSPAPVFHRAEANPIPARSNSKLQALLDKEDAARSLKPPQTPPIAC